jgi:DNA-formamidopyrimidine glycosylase
MAEGHAVARWGDALQAFVGETVVDLRVPRRWQERAAALVGHRVTEVRTHGKHLVLAFSAPLVIHTHAMQYGSWQIGERGFEPRKDARFIRLRIVTDRHEALFFHGPVMEILTPDEFAVHERFQGLGPDLLHARFDVEAVVARIKKCAAREIADVLLDQRVVAGIGNIYKSEGLFLAGIHPRTPAPAAPAEDLRELFATLIPLMQAGRFRYGMSLTLPEELQWDGCTRNWVYRRRGQPCFVCASPILMIRQGELQRATYFCATCQTPAPSFSIARSLKDAHRS